ncbi:mitochondrial fission ELM1 family protein [Taklimakanibacter lacteus]|uniref:mitochondrial fission ELM1 family protein n=1 Tax=Taklimakanibacter lacteus TaxID=2268456 RepID=UPI000E662988
MLAELSDARYLVWVLQGAREGDNAQARALAEKLSAAVVLKRLNWSWPHILPNVILGRGLAAVDRKMSDSLMPPWPDAVIAVGRRAAPVAAWIKRQSGGRTRLIHLGRPRLPFDLFDLMITTPQYALPDGHNVIKALLPATGAATVPADGLWRSRFSGLPRPWTGVLVGGATFPFRFGRGEARRLAEALRIYQRQTGGSLLVSTSPRSGSEIADILSAVLGSGNYVHRWTGGGGNPHRFILSEADRFIVTEDSASMLAEACRSHKPVEIFALSRWPWALSWPGERGLAAALAQSGLVSPPRNVRRLRDEIIRRGHASRLGVKPARSFTPYDDEWEAIARRIDGLLQSSAQGH